MLAPPAKRAIKAGFNADGSDAHGSNPKPNHLVVGYFVMIDALFSPRRVAGAAPGR